MKRARESDELVRKEEEEEEEEGGCPEEEEARSRHHKKHMHTPMLFLLPTTPQPRRQHHHRKHAANHQQSPHPKTGRQGVLLASKASQPPPLGDHPASFPPSFLLLPGPRPTLQQPWWPRRSLLWTLRGRSSSPAIIGGTFP